MLMELLTMAIVLVVVATVTSKPCCEQMCNNNCTNTMHGIKTKIDGIRRKREGVKTVSSTTDEELIKAHAPHERMQGEPKKQKESKDDWEDLTNHDYDDNGNQNLAELLTSIDSEMTSMQASQVEEENDRFDEILQF